jgi:nucleoside-diphosphate-sugar epimerase
VPGSLSDPGALDELCADCGAVVHAAGVVRGACQADFDRVNVDGTAAVIASLKRLQNPPRLLLLSSLAAREPGLSWYAASKRGGEDCVREAADLDWVILRPPAVYGPGDREMLPVFKLMSRGVAPVAGSADARIALIHVADLVAAIIACLQSETTRHRTLSPSDGAPEGYDWHQMAAIAGEVWSRKVRIWRIPGLLLDALATVNLSRSRLFGGAPMLTPAKLRELRHPDWRVDVHEVTEATGWAPEIDLRRGLEALRNSAL